MVACGTSVKMGTLVLAIPLFVQIEPLVLAIPVFVHALAVMAFSQRIFLGLGVIFSHIPIRRRRAGSVLKIQE